jgi:hypothetical protein
MPVEVALFCAITSQNSTDRRKEFSPQITPSPSERMGVSGLFLLQNFTELAFPQGWENAIGLSTKTDRNPRSRATSVDNFPQPGEKVGITLGKVELFAQAPGFL